MYYIFALFSLLVITQVQAKKNSANGIDKIIAQGGFYTKSNLPIKPKNLSEAVFAVATTSSCSAVLLSPNGYVATNIHCLKSCLNPGGTFSKPYTPDIEKESVRKNRIDKNGKIHTLYAGEYFPHPVPTKLKCPPYSELRLSVSKHQELDELYQLGDPKVVWMGSGRHHHDESRISEFTEDEFKSFKDLTEDIAILKYDRIFSPVSLPCLKLSKKPPKRGDLSWLIGYPSKNSRPNGHGSDGSILFTKISIGRVRTSVTEDPILQAVAKKLNTQEQKVFWQREKSIWERPHLLLTSTDGYSQNSGSAIINGDGKLVAIAFTIFGLSSTKYNAGSLIGVRMDHIRDSIISDLGQQKADEIFYCP